MASVNQEFKYDVFLSFRGEDTRYGFTGHLWKALDDKGVRTFMDDGKLQKGDEITPSLFKAIDESKIAIVVLSKNYASSSFCLQELSKILDTMKDKAGHSVFPVFYKVDPSDIRKLKRSFGEAMDKHKANSSLDKWKVSLHQVADLSGFHYKGDMPEHKFIGEIVEQVLGIIKLVSLHVGDYLVGLDHQKQHVTSLLNFGSDDTVHMVAIHGIGGIGKTTLAISVYNLIAHQFDVSCFLENVRENHEKHGLPYLQKIILSKVAEEKKELTGVLQGISILEQRLKQKKLLLILDDVNKLEQLEALAGKHKWFGPSSRIIITTRDKKLLTCHGVERTYEVNGLNDKDALELVRWKAFKDEFSPSCNNNVSLAQMHVLERVVAYASGHPLALEVMGSHFYNKTIEQCKVALDHYEKVPHKKIQTTLQLSFDALEDKDKFVFLDIACCFKGWKLTRVEEILHAQYGNIMKDNINVLVEKSLIKISESGNVTMHDLVEDMGKEIVRQESPENPGKRSRLWFSEDIMHVLEENTGTNQIEIIRFDCWTRVAWDGEAFKKMENLKTLIFSDYVFFKKHPKHLPNSLRVLECRYPSSGCRKLRSIPPLKLNSLETLDFSSCHRLESFPLVVNGFLGKLKTLLVTNCYNLKSIPPLKLDSLEVLDLSCCCSLESFPCVVDELLDKLKFLNIECCIMLRNIPRLRLTSLEHFNLSYCYSLKSFPEILGEMRNMPGVLMDETPIKELPFPFKNLTQPKTLCECGYVYLPNRMSTLAEFTIKNEEKVNTMQSLHVKYICVRRCNLSDEYLSKSLMLFANVKELHLTSNHFTVIPKSIEYCKSLWKLVLDDCKALQEIKGIPPCLRMLSALNCISLTSSCKSKLLNQELHEAGNTWFRLPRATFPEWFDHHCLARLSFSFWFRNKFPAIALCVVCSSTLHDSQRPVRVVINGNTFFYTHDSKIDRSSRPDMYHLHLFHMQMENFNENMDKALSENKWNHAELDFGLSFLESGIHVLKERSSMNDIRFINPKYDVFTRDFEVTDLPQAMLPPESFNLSAELSSTSNEIAPLLNNLPLRSSSKRHFSHKKEHHCLIIKKKRIVELIESQTGALDKFIVKETQVPIDDNAISIDDNIDAIPIDAIPDNVGAWLLVHEDVSTENEEFSEIVEEGVDQTEEGTTLEGCGEFEIAQEIDTSHKDEFPQERPYTEEAETVENEEVMQVTEKTERILSKEESMEGKGKKVNKVEIDRVIDEICALFNKPTLGRIWTPHQLYLKFMEFLPKRAHTRPGECFMPLTCIDHQIARHSEHILASRVAVDLRPANPHQVHGDDTYCLNCSKPRYKFLAFLGIECQNIKQGPKRIKLGKSYFTMVSRNPARRNISPGEPNIEQFQRVGKTGQEHFAIVCIPFDLDVV
ncbi:disease resistance protein (TIR-NBS-LRR class), putative [Medicago truncatula]|uniref:Disease resistance protein (TIR-NBS-LRR class), putative n=1 Tax=Medicago truncatula TaxID=3880 RepID=A0A072TJ75_MEDTR|nr:disease resistance protein (TIR-NBS-LRR class), putative [Medicago truncatula]